MGDKNRNWPEANQLAIYKRDRGFELGTYREQVELVVRGGIWIRDLRIASPALWPLGHAASHYWVQVG